MRSMLWPRFKRATLLGTLSMLIAFALFPAASQAAAEPVIEGESASNVSGSDATLEARIVPGSPGAGVYYQFQVVSNLNEYLSEIACPTQAVLKGTDACLGGEVEGALPIGYLPAGSSSKTVSVDLANAGMTLTPGATYHFRVLVATAVLTEDSIEWQSPPSFGSDQLFVAATPPSVEFESVSQVAQGDATLEAQINPQSADEGDYYQFQVVGNAGEFLDEIACPPRAQLRGADGCQGAEVEGALPISYLAKGSSPQSVSLDLAKAGAALSPGTTYHYRVLVVKVRSTEDTIQWKYPIIYGPDQTFTTLPAGTAPAVESVSLSHLTSSDATLEAQINTEGLSTIYEFQMWSSPCSKHGAGCEVLIDIHLPSGLLLGSFVGQSVSLDLNSVGVTLNGGEYGFTVKATSSAGSTQGQALTFEPPESVLTPLTKQGGGDGSFSGGQSTTNGAKRDGPKPPGPRVAGMGSHHKSAPRHHKKHKKHKKHRKHGEKSALRKGKRHKA